MCVFILGCSLPLPNYQQVCNFLSANLATVSDAQSRKPMRSERSATSAVAPFEVLGFWVFEFQVLRPNSDGG